MDPFGLESSEEVGEALEVFAGSCERGLRVLQEVAPGEVVLSTASTLPPCVSCDDFAATAAQRWPEFPSSERRKLLQLRWRSAGPVSEAEPQCVLDWPGGGSTASAPPPNARLRGVAACNGMAVAKLVLKPSLLKTLEAQPRHGLAVYPNGSLINHSCLPNVNRLPFQSCLVVRSSRRLMPGQEITSAYIEVRQPVFARHLELTSWDFTCGCWRCRLELHLAALGCDSAAEARRLWRRFERLRRTGACAEQDLQNLVDSAENHTRNLLKDFLAAQDPLPEDIAREFQRLLSAAAGLPLGGPRVGARLRAHSPSPRRGPAPVAGSARGHGGGGAFVPGPRGRFHGGGVRSGGGDGFHSFEQNVEAPAAGEPLRLPRRLRTRHLAAPGRGAPGAA
ncbi:unnamed protein product [Effrenium voratum]|uniref:SET domain-containing protein n=1 Tax=Effrenium voratum TaxID=2562239 RepID=A0AA36JQQ9_9DINO|nr:unnamed protein product [Effrenium voratum]